MDQLFSEKLIQGMIVILGVVYFKHLTPNRKARPTNTSDEPFC